MNGQNSKVAYWWHSVNSILLVAILLTFIPTFKRGVENQQNIAVIKGNRYTDKDAHKDYQEFQRQLIEMKKEIPPEQFEKRVDTLERRVESLEKK